MAVLTFLKKWVFRLFLVLIAFFTVIAAADNSTPVPLFFLGYESWALPVSGWVLVSFVLGGLFGMATNVWTNTRLRLSARQSSKEAKLHGKALDQARASNLPVVADAVAD